MKRIVEQIIKAAQSHGTSVEHADPAENCPSRQDSGLPARRKHSRGADVSKRQKECAEKEFDN